jgi:hypothetical protein
MKNWKTALTVSLGGILQGANELFQLGISPSLINTITVIILGFVSKDYDKTGVGA